MIDGEPTGCLFLFGWPRASLWRWLINLSIWAVIIAVLYFAFTWLGLWNTSRWRKRSECEGLGPARNRRIFRRFANGRVR